MKPSNDYIDQLVEFSSTIRQLTLKRLEEVPDGFANWRLNNEAMSFAHLVQHIINVDELFFRLTKTSKKTFSWILGSEEPHTNIDELTYISMLKKLKDYGVKRNTIISTFNVTSINQLVRNEDGESMTLWWFLMHNILEHETYHTGQIAAYLKVLKGEFIKI